MGTGAGRCAPLELAREILDEAGMLDGLVGVQPEALLRRGLGEAKAASVLAALELARAECGLFGARDETWLNSLK